MAKIHTPGDGHVAPSPVGDVEWLVYGASLASQKRTLERALFILRNNVRGMKPCNDCFSRLPGRRTFDDILDDPDVWISYERQTANFGHTNVVGGKEVTVSQLSFNMGRWTVAATLIHEFAHVNSAPDNTHDAEGTLLCCGMQAAHQPGVMSAVGGSGNSRYA